MSKYEAMWMALKDCVERKQLGKTGIIFADDLLKDMNDLEVYAEQPISYEGGECRRQFDLNLNREQE